MRGSWVQREPYNTPVLIHTGKGGGGEVNQWEG
jgi:hypothetical protein